MTTLDKDFKVKNGIVAGSTIVAPASTTAVPSFRLPHGTAPTTPTDGDVWTTTAGVFARVNGATVGPLSAGGGAVDDISSATGAAATATLFSDVTTGSIGIGLGITSGSISIGNNTTGVGIVGILVGSPTTGTKTVNIGTNGQAGSTTNITIGTASGSSSITLNGTVTFSSVPTFNTLNATTATSAASLFPNVTTSTGSISIGAGLTTGALQLATVGTGATPITIGHTNATIGITGNTTVTGNITTSGNVDSSAATGTIAFAAAKTTGTITIGAGLTTGALQIATVGTGATAITMGHTNATIGITGAVTISTSISLGASATATTPANTDNDTSVATTAFVQTLATHILPYQRQGTLVVAAGVTRFRFPVAVTIVGISMACNTAPTGAAILADINKNGTTIFTTQGNRPTIAISAFNTAAEVTNMDVTAFAAGDYLTVDIDQIGSTVAGADLTVAIRYRTA